MAARAKRGTDGCIDVPPIGGRAQRPMLDPITAPLSEAVFLRARDGENADERADAIVHSLMTAAARAGTQALRLYAGQPQLVIDALWPDGAIRRVAALDRALGAAVLKRLALLADEEALALERVVAGDDVIMLVRLPASEPPAFALSITGVPHQFAERVAHAMDRRTGLVLVADPDAHGRARTIAALGDHHRAAGRAVLSLDRLHHDRQISLHAALACAERVAADTLLIDTLQSAESVRMAMSAAGSRLVVAGVSSGDALGAISLVAPRKPDRFDLACVLRAVIAQRALRRLCGACKQPVQASRSDAALLGFDAGAMVFRAVGCGRCRGSGFSGEIAAMEVVRADDALRRLIGVGGDAAILARHAFLNTPNLGAAARALVREGETTPAEAIRITRSSMVAA
ncbi:hypothetical protein KY084_01530 [Stakelama sp. CBK3Z-3]|uniref:Bacterial type II secretion system protein E domain-containing protein n=1 Tax=Stakelama flava TaxID=2860338 RepID=A0ABS6XH72_9SPHN|nr:hypothetical protein [Stakelama flava]MBW4329557.1 hypothetical protein [Stakelama flava]